MTRLVAMDKRGAGGTLLEWLTDELRLSGAPDVERLAGGWSNVTSRVTDSTGSVVILRQPPSSHAGGGAHDVLREARILTALQYTAVPVPTVLAVCTDDAVTGQPFYVMSCASGAVLGSAEEARCIGVEHRRQLGLDLVELLADVQDVDLDAVGLADLRRRTPYVHRQLRRWRAQWQASTDRIVPAVEHVADRLQRWADDLTPGAEVLVHQDFRLGNVMVTAPASISALLDWELTTTGHPLADLGFLGARMQAPAEVLEDGQDPSAVEGYPSLDELAAHFERRTGVPVDDLPTFVALAAWRWSIIVAGVAQRAGDETDGAFHRSARWHRRRVEVLADFAASLLP